MRILLAFKPAVGANPESYPHFHEGVSGVWHGRTVRVTKAWFVTPLQGAPPLGSPYEP
jgi:hypothetical protein